MTRPHVWIIVLHWKELELTRKCLRSLQGLNYQPYDVLLVDNDSDDGSLEQLQREFPSIPSIKLAANTGFAGGCNKGIEYVLARGADFIVLLNNDARMSTEVLTQLVDAALADPKLGVLTPKVVWQDQPNRLYGLGGYRLPFRVRLKGMEALDTGPWSGPPIALDFIFGCCMLIKRAVIEQIGGFDERFFMYFEDIDFCYRATDAGYTVAYLPGAVLPHIGAGSTQSRSGRREFLVGWSRQLFFRKHVRGWWWLVYAVYEPLYTIRFIFRLLRKRHWRAALLYVGGMVGGLVVQPVATLPLR